MKSVLTREQRSFYKTNGYLHAPNVIPSDLLGLLRTVLSRWADDTIESWMKEGLIDDSQAGLDFQHRLAHVWETAGRPNYVRSPRRDLVSREMFDILVHPALISLAQDLLDTPEISVHGIFNARPKLPDQIWTLTPWHQDAQYYRDAEQVHVTSIWMPLQPVTEHNSCLQVAPGLHRGPLHEGWNDPETGFLGLAPEVRDSLKGVSIEMEPGDALCFTQITPHRALPNRSNQVRWSIDVRYESTAQATETGQKQGFVAHSLSDPTSVLSYEEWLTQWEDIPAGSY
ncbi:MAG: phytanoyl-CoA dioxygenase family protein [Caldilineaceae bacterium]|nr:phytanoyl-CoA dioxygenase family protein [Caldilineaceae bacterium]